MQTCPHCHQPVTAGSRFCEHCGYDLTQTQAPAATAGRRRANSPSPRSHHHWLGKVLGGVIALAVIVVAFLGVGFYHRQAGKPKQITTITDAITANQSNDLAKHLTSDDPSLKITGDTVQPFLDYTRKHPQYQRRQRHHPGEQRCGDHGQERPLHLHRRPPVPWALHVQTLGDPR